MRTGQILLFDIMALVEHWHERAVVSQLTFLELGNDTYELKWLGQFRSYSLLVSGTLLDRLLVRWFKARGIIEPSKPGLSTSTRVAASSYKVASWTALEPTVRLSFGAMRTSYRWTISVAGTWDWAALLEAEDLDKIAHAYLSMRGILL